MFQVIINTLIASLSLMLWTDVPGVSAGPVLALSNLSPNDIRLVRAGSSLVSARNNACNLDNTFGPSCVSCGIVVEEEVNGPGDSGLVLELVPTTGLTGKLMIIYIM